MIRPEFSENICLDPWKIFSDLGAMCKIGENEV
jgi:hypothetical protein